MSRQFRIRVLGPLAALAVGISTMVAASMVQANVLAPGAITLVVPYTPGGTTDLLARRIAQGMSEQLKRPVVVDNRPGGGTAIAASTVARAAPDGRTLLIASNATLAVNQHLGIKLGYAPDSSFDYISLLATVPNVVVTRPDARWRSLADVMASSKTGQPASYGSMGTGTSTHIAMEVLNQALSAQLTHVPYKGSAPALVDLMGGHVDVVIDTLVATLPHLREGKLRALAVLSAQRSSSAPDIPTAKEALGRDINIYSWFGLVAPKGTPPNVMAALHDAAVSVLKAPALQKELGPQGVDLVGSDPRAFGEFVKDQQRMYSEIISTNKLKLN
ncbi:Bug family tripartite tricarboxylate transporter substrate binding protein [Variovorax terrae]|uniref:Tripartite tricarboxylate transporter substrate binding protein n=1 Tax=Variovorax terrae TaxID=2923278 RepID=A0A9X1W1S4_9BURK|nr:tripartite tricarboxylate transporter substrate binding protein [Variovorax terrae]MCJ0766187.1 tripartite tricarboxylate transporter substrate binding protein [Variovorax terrae]